MTSAGRSAGAARLTTRAVRGRVRVEVEPSTGGSASALELDERGTLAAIQSLSRTYATLCGASPDSVARGVERTLRNRTAAARERQRLASQGTA